MSEDTQPLDTREKSQLLACRLSHGLLFLSLATGKAGSWACPHGFLLTADRALPVTAAHEVESDWWVTQWPLTTWTQTPPGHKGNKCQQRTKDLLSFLTGAEMRNWQTAIVIKAGVLRVNVASEPAKERGHPLPKPEKWVNTQPLCVTTTPQGGTEMSFSPQLSPFNMRDSNKRRHATVLRRGQGLWKL